jgi:hypothetical protein
MTSVTSQVSREKDYPLHFDSSKVGATPAQAPSDLELPRSTLQTLKHALSLQ